MNHLSLPINLSNEIIFNIFNRFLDLRIIRFYEDIVTLRVCYREKDYKRLRLKCGQISAAIAIRYGTGSYSSNCIDTKIYAKDAIRIIILGKDYEIELFPIGNYHWNMNLNVHDSDLILARILAYLTLEHSLGKGKIKLDHKETTVGIGLATLSMIISDNLSEARILEDLGQDRYYQ